jgi:peptide/nickel transport system ATP-binding protein
MSLLEIQNLVVQYPRRGGAPVVALRGVSLRVAAGESVGIVGESGCGKSTLVKAIVGLVTPLRGRIVYDGRDVTHRQHAEREAFCRCVQMVFQDASGSLNPRLTVAGAIEEVLRVHGLAGSADGAGSSTDRADRGAGHPAAAVLRLLEQVGLPPEVASAYPRELSGGQCQRVSLARCLALGPSVLLADEPVSALDVSVQARVLNLLRELQQRLGLALVLVSHDLAVVRTVCDRVHVMHDGVIVEQGEVAEVLEQPRHPYTRALLAAVPDVDRALAGRAALGAAGARCGVPADPGRGHG